MSRISLFSASAALAAAPAAHAAALAALSSICGHVAYSASTRFSKSTMCDFRGRHNKPCLGSRGRGHPLGNSGNGSGTGQVKPDAVRHVSGGSFERELVY